MCNKYFIYEDEIDETVLEVVNKYIELLLDLKNKLNTKDNENNLLWLEQFKGKEKFEKVDRKLVINFIDEIRIGNNKESEIDLKFKNQYNRSLDYLKRHNL